MDEYILVLIAVMLIAGIFGGVINYYFNRKNDPEDITPTKCIIIGTGASFLMPLFLNMISSDLLSKGKDNPDPLKILIFFGFCLIAAISSTAFIRTISDRVLREAKEARKVAATAISRVEEVKSTVDPIANKATEQEPAEEGMPLLQNLALELDDNKRRVLEALGGGQYTFRTLSGLSKDTGLDRPNVNEILTNLISKGLAGQAMRRKGIKWFITEDGRRALSARR